MPVLVVVNLVAFIKLAIKSDKQREKKKKTQQHKKN